MRPLAVPLAVVALALVLSPLACKKSRPSGSASGDGGASASSSGSGEAAALAPGFEGNVTMHVTSAHGGPQDLVFHMKGNKTRLDVPTHDGEVAHVLFDAPSQKTVIVLDSKHMFLDVDHRAWMRAPGPHALPATITQTGKHETVAGTDCEDWEIAEAVGTRTAACIAQGVAFFDFRPDRPTVVGMQPRNWMDELRMKQAFPLRSVETDATGKEASRMEVTQIEKAPIDDSLFVIPPDYKPMPAAHPGQFLLPSAPKGR
jgi:hypothetical protein